MFKSRGSPKNLLVYQKIIKINLSYLNVMSKFLFLFYFFHKNSDYLTNFMVKTTLFCLSQKLSIYEFFKCELTFWIPPSHRKIPTIWEILWWKQHYKNLLHFYQYLKSENLLMGFLKLFFFPQKKISIFGMFSYHTGMAFCYKFFTWKNLCYN